MHLEKLCQGHTAPRGSRLSIPMPYATKEPCFAELLPQANFRPDPQRGQTPLCALSACPTQSLSHRCGRTHLRHQEKTVTRMELALAKEPRRLGQSRVPVPVLWLFRPGVCVWGGDR